MAKQVSWGAARNLTPTCGRPEPLALSRWNLKMTDVFFKNHGVLDLLDYKNDLFTSTDLPSPAFENENDFLQPLFGICRHTYHSMGLNWKKRPLTEFSRFAIIDPIFNTANAAAQARLRAGEHRLLYEKHSGLFSRYAVGFGDAAFICDQLDPAMKYNFLQRVRLGVLEGKRADMQQGVAQMLMGLDCADRMIGSRLALKSLVGFATDGQNFLIADYLLSDTPGRPRAVKGSYAAEFADYEYLLDEKALTALVRTISHKLHAVMLATQAAIEQYASTRQQRQDMLRKEEDDHEINMRLIRQLEEGVEQLGRDTLNEQLRQLISDSDDAARAVALAHALNAEQEMAERLRLENEVASLQQQLKELRLAAGAAATATLPSNESDG